MTSHPLGILPNIIINRYRLTVLVIIPADSDDGLVRSAVVPS